VFRRGSLERGSLATWPGRREGKRYGGFCRGAEAIEEGGGVEAERLGVGAEEGRLRESGGFWRAMEGWAWFWRGGGIKRVLRGSCGISERRESAGT
jgi:hypothetical protein